MRTERRNSLIEIGLTTSMDLENTTGMPYIRNTGIRYFIKTTRRGCSASRRYCYAWCSDRSCAVRAGAIPLPPSALAVDICWQARDSKQPTVGRCLQNHIIESISIRVYHFARPPMIVAHGSPAGARQALLLCADTALRIFAHNKWLRWL